MLSGRSAWSFVGRQFCRGDLTWSRYLGFEMLGMEIWLLLSLISNAISWIRPYFWTIWRFLLSRSLSLWLRLVLYFTLMNTKIAQSNEFLRWKYLLNCFFGSFFLFCLVGELVKCMLEVLVISSAFNVVQKSLIKCQFGFRLQLIVHSIETIGLVSVLLALGEWASGCMRRLPHLIHLFPYELLAAYSVVRLGQGRFGILLSFDGFRAVGRVGYAIDGLNVAFLSTVWDPWSRYTGSHSFIICTSLSSNQILFDCWKLIWVCDILNIWWQEVASRAGFSIFGGTLICFILLMYHLIIRKNVAANARGCSVIVRIDMDWLC